MNVRSRSARWPALALAAFAALAVTRFAPGEAASRVAESEARLKRDVTFLASDACEGRGVTTEGIRKAADYIAAEFRKAGLKPGGVDGTYFQPFTIPGATLEAPATLSLRGPKGKVVALKQGTDFYPMGLGHAGKVDGLPVVFAGFGISSDSEPEYDDYADLDVADKVVVVLRDAPRPGVSGGDAFATSGRRNSLGALAAKAVTAQKHHAAALLIANDAGTVAEIGGDHLLDFNYTALMGSRAEIPVFHVRRSVLEAMLPGGATELADFERETNRDLKPHGRALEGWSASLAVKMKRDRVALKNVIGVLEGAGPLAKETVVVGAHYDHLGYGGPFGMVSASLARLKKMAIHHGADDNGSGTTAVMELARRFGSAPPPASRRRLVFMTFSGEEMGLLGSAHYAKNPIFPLADTVAMVNLDMVGRVKADESTGHDKLLVEGTGTAKTFDALLEAVNKKYQFKLVKKASGYGPSDHTSFYTKKVPVFFFWNGVHEDYHRPSDTADKINVPGLRKVADFSEEVIGHLATVAERPEYVQVKGSSDARAGTAPRLGIQPSYSDGETDKGVLLDGVAADGPASRAGLKAGDRIVEIAGEAVKNLESYMTVMRGRKSTGTLELVIVRGGKRVPVTVKLE